MVVACILEASFSLLDTQAEKTTDSPCLHLPGNSFLWLSHPTPKLPKYSLRPCNVARGRFLSKVPSSSAGLPGWGVGFLRLSLLAGLVRVSVAMMKSHDQSNLGRKEFLWLTLPQHSLPLKEVRTAIQMAGRWRQELSQRPWRGTAY